MSDSATAVSLGQLIVPKKPQSPVYRLHHYTSFDAVKEILRSNRLRLTHAAFSDDPTELSHGLGIMQDLHGQTWKDIFDTTDFHSLLYYELQPYVFCLSESEDMLSQWYMYSGRNGCCITFDHEISELTAGDDMGLGPVLYEEEEQREHLQYLDRERSNLQHRPQGNANTNLYFLLSVVFLKNAAFSQEKEWRIVKLVQQDSRKTIEYHSGSRFLKPYVTVSHNPLPIKKITIGPADDQERLLLSMRHLTRMTEGYENVVIEKLAIQFSP